LKQVIAKYPQFVTTTTPKLNLGGSTQGMIHNTQKNRDAFVSGIKNDFLVSVSLHTVIKHRK
jgi:hypothetical protein